MCSETRKEQAAVVLRSIAGRVLGKYNFCREDRKISHFLMHSGAVSGLFPNQSQLKVKGKEEKGKEKKLKERKKIQRREANEVG